MYRRLYFKYYKLRASYRRRRRLLFPSPAELRFVVLMGGKVLKIKRLRDPRTGFCFALIWRRPRIFKHEFVQREVRVGPYFIDFGNDIGRGIEIDGQDYHRDIVAEFERDSYLYQRDWHLLHIQAYLLWQQPDRVQREVVGFLTK